MQGVIIHTIKHKFGAYKYISNRIPQDNISDLSRPLQTIRVIDNAKHIGE